MDTIKKNKTLIRWLRSIKRIISKLPGGRVFADTVQKIIFRLWFRNPEELFTFYYNTNKWGHAESRVGTGIFACRHREDPELVTALVGCIENR